MRTCIFRCPRHSSSGHNVLKLKLKTVVLIQQPVADPTRSRNTPIIIGVSGHRDLDPESVPRVRAAVGTFLEHIRILAPETQIRVMVGMAEGADLLVAEVALERGVPVDAVLPMPLDHYAEDFGAKSFELLRNLLQRAEVRRIELATPVQSNDGILDSRAASNRDVFYVNLRNCLIRKSALLLAVWDGESSPLPGGTADTVLRFLGARSDEDRLEEPIAFMEEQPESAGSRLVYWVPTGRSGGAAPEGTRPSCFLSGVGENRLMRHERATGEFAHHLRELNGYNREFEGLQRKARFAFTDTLMGSLPEDVPLQDR